MSEHGGWMGGWPGSAPHQLMAFHLPSRLEILAMRLTALMLRVLVRLGFTPKAEAEEVYQYLEM